MASATKWSIALLVICVLHYPLSTLSFDCRLNKISYDMIKEEIQSRIRHGSDGSEHARWQLQELENTMGKDLRSRCQNINECHRKDACIATARCEDTRLAYNCICKAGYKGNGDNCYPINECATNQHNCHRDAICHDKTPFFTCKCKPGYKGNGRNCIAMDGCEIKGIKCPPALKCVKQGDNYVCGCNNGFKVVGGGNARKCKAMNECEKKGLNCPPALKCVKHKNSYECGCNPGFKVVGGGNARTCKAMDECEKKGRICPPALKCLKQKDKSYACDCDPGYKIVGEGNDWTCKGEIYSNTVNIEKISICLNRGREESVGNDDFSICQLLLVIIKEKTPVLNTTTSDVPQEAPKGDALDDCEKAGDACPSSLQCLAQENATYSCGCEAGLMVTGHGDERTCEGTINSSSKDWGYVTVPKYYSTRPVDDIYECRMQGDVCPPTLNCLKKENGSHVCGCEKKGYVVKGDDQERTCEDVDECTQNPCAKDEQCVNVPGKFECHCKDGYVKVGGSCKSASKCLNIKCKAHERCHDGICRCKKGYRKSKATKGNCVKALTFKGASPPQSSSVIIYGGALVIGYLGHLYSIRNCACCSLY
ncbi:unnamed protein product [Porites evermanni]|uniref:EGF-like domain-containing protein n=1 Tax=Porites evermanni TaxID=104178 RepID=A0ABN8Q7Q2_9CNID|nr:unnamed protein product [Porites evermanni]